MSKTPRVLMIADISGEGVEYHVGDEAMAEVAIERLKQIVGTDNIVMTCAHPDGVPATYSIKSSAHHSLTDAARKKLIFTRPHSYIKGLLRMVRNLRQCDVLFICGGGNLTSEWPGVLESRMYLISWALKLKKRVILVSQTLGPYSEEHRARISTLLEKVEWVGVRDKHYSHTQIPSPVHFAVDDASYLKPKHSEWTQSVINENKPCIAFSMRKFGKASDGLLTTLCKEVVKITNKQNLRTIFIPHHAPAHEGDIRLAKNNEALWPEDKPLTIMAPIPLAAPLKALTGDCEWTISMRYHQIIFSLAMGVPVIGVYVNEYTQAKLHGAFEQFGLAPRLMAIDEVEGKLEQLVEQVISEKTLFEAAAKRVAEEELTGSMRPYNLVTQAAGS